MKTKIAQLATFSLLLGASAFAQGAGHVGGGNITEADLQSYMNKLDVYLMSDEGRQAFPEIVTYDQTHPNESFHELVLKVHPVVRQGELRDGFGNVRDCLSYIDQRYFVCNSDDLPVKTLDNQPSFYRIVFHELLVQAGIEKPISGDIPSEYPVSSRITENVHLETYQEWVPGKTQSNAQKPQALACSIHVDSFRFDRLVLKTLRSKGFTVVDDQDPAEYHFSLWPSCWGGCTRTTINSKLRIRNSDFDMFFLTITDDHDSNRYEGEAYSFGGEQDAGSFFRPILRVAQWLQGQGLRSVIKKIPTCDEIKKMPLKIDHR